MRARRSGSFAQVPIEGLGTAGARSGRSGIDRFWNEPTWCGSFVLYTARTAFREGMSGWWIIPRGSLPSTTERAGEQGTRWHMPSKMAYQWLMYSTQMSSSSESSSSFEHSIRFTVWSKIQSLMTAMHSSVFLAMSFPQKRITVHPR